MRYIIFSFLFLIISSCATSRTKQIATSGDVILPVFQGNLDTIYQIHVEKPTETDAYKLKNGQLVLVKGYFHESRILIETKKNGMNGYTIIKPFSFVRAPNPSLGWPAWQALDAILVNIGWVPESCLKDTAITKGQSAYFKKPVVIEGVVKKLNPTHQTSRLPSKIFRNKSYSVDMLWSIIRQQLAANNLASCGVNYLPIYIEQTKNARSETKEEEQAAIDREKRAEEDSFWKKTTKTNTIVGYESYLETYPKGRYVKQAIQYFRSHIPAKVKRLVKQIEQNMVEIPGNQFTMGCTEGQRVDCDSSTLPIQQITIRHFRMSKFELTQSQWQLLMDKNPSFFKGCDDCPVESVSWDDVQKYIKRLNNFTGKHYRLPSESEWEYAARGGHDYKFSGGDDFSLLGWDDRNSGDRTHPVGQKLPNTFGLYDMSGNILEWCQDSYINTLQGIPKDGQARVMEQKDGYPEEKIVRGGCWHYWNGRSVSSRWREFSNLDLKWVGFRLVQ